MSNGKIGVLIEAHFDELEYHKFNEFFPAHGYEVEYLSYLWCQDQQTYIGNDNKQQVTVTTDVISVDPTDYKALILIGGYAMDRLRYQKNPRQDKPNRAPAVTFLRKAVEAMDQGKLKIGTICHSLWLFCAAPETLRGRRVTCAHNLICDVENAGATLIYNEDGIGLIDTYVDGNLITGKHPEVIDQFMDVFLTQLEGSKVGV